MKRIAKAAAARPYRSELRDGQAQATRERILDAAMRVMARGIASLSVPAVAREAGVSVPTVYRHFGTKRGLLAAVYPHAARQAGLDQLVPPTNLEELRDGVRAYFGGLDGLGKDARAAMASIAADEVRGATMANRMLLWERLADSVQPPLAPADRDRLVRVLAVLVTSASMRMWHDHLGTSVDQAADDVAWLANAAVAASRRQEA
jgi:AcrR family transcriptional regulator